MRQMQSGSGKTMGFGKSKLIAMKIKIKLLLEVAAGIDEGKSGIGGNSRIPEGSY